MSSSRCRESSRLFLAISTKFCSAKILQSKDDTQSALVKRSYPLLIAHYKAVLLQLRQVLLNALQPLNQAHGIELHSIAEMRRCSLHIPTRLMSEIGTYVGLAGGFELLGVLTPQHMQHCKKKKVRIQKKQ